MKPPPSKPPWTGAASRAARLPSDRDAWLAVVVGAIRATATHPRTAKHLRAMGYDMGGPRAGDTVARWYAWVEAHREELGIEPLPPRVGGAQPGDPPVKTSFQKGDGRKRGAAPKRRPAKAPARPNGAG